MFPWYPGAGCSRVLAEGGLYYSARWHTAARRVVYLAESPAGALVHRELDEQDWARSCNRMQVEDPARLNVVRLDLRPTKGWERNLKLTRLGDERGRGGIMHRSSWRTRGQPQGASARSASSRIRSRCAGGARCRRRGEAARFLRRWVWSSPRGCRARA